MVKDGVETVLCEHAAFKDCLIVSDEFSVASPYYKVALSKK